MQKHARITIPMPVADLYSLQVAVQALKEAVETMYQMRGAAEDGVVTYRDMVALGLMTAADIPKHGEPPVILNVLSKSD